MISVNNIEIRPIFQPQGLTPPAQRRTATECFWNAPSEGDRWLQICEDVSAREPGMGSFARAVMRDQGQPGNVRIADAPPPVCSGVYVDRYSVLFLRLGESFVWPVLVNRGQVWATSRIEDLKPALDGAMVGEARITAERNLRSVLALANAAQAGQENPVALQAAGLYQVVATHSTAIHDGTLVVSDDILWLADSESGVLVRVGQLNGGGSNPATGQWLLASSDDAKAWEWLRAEMAADSKEVADAVEPTKRARCAQTSFEKSLNSLSLEIFGQMWEYVYNIYVVSIALLVGFPLAIKFASRNQSTSQK